MSFILHTQKSMTKKSKIDHYTDKEALDFHNKGKSGKIEIISSKSLTTKRDLSLAYSPGVAIPVKEISKNPEMAYDYTTKGNLVAVISNGTAILGLGNLGAIASKPVMEGKAVLFKRFADIDAIDLEIDSTKSEEIINSIKNFAKSFGGINLEDIAAPDCFVIEEKLKKILDIFFIDLIISSVSLVSISMSIESISPNLLNKTALPPITGFDAIAPKLPNPNIAEPLLITATKLPFVV